MSVRVGNFSRLLFNDLLLVDGFECWNTLDLPEIPIRQGDMQHVVESIDQIDRLAYAYYNNANLWWVIAAANNLEILPTDLKEGMTLRIPEPDYITGPFFASSARR